MKSQKANGNQSGRHSNEEIEVKPLPEYKILWNILRNPSYMLSVISMTIICFVQTGLQYWITNYCVTVLGADQNTIIYLFSAVVIIGPASGAFFCGWLSTKLIGGYLSNKALLFCFAIFLAFTVAAIPTPFINNSYAVMAVVLVQWFFGAGVEPNLTGVILNTVNPIERPTASSFAIFFYNLFAYIPAPYLYGFIQDFTKDINEQGDNVTRVPFMIIQFSTAIGAVALLLALLLKKNS